MLVPSMMNTLPVFLKGSSYCLHRAFFTSAISDRNCTTSYFKRCLEYTVEWEEEKKTKGKEKQNKQQKLTK